MPCWNRALGPALQSVETETETKWVCLEARALAMGTVCVLSSVYKTDTKTRSFVYKNKHCAEDGGQTEQAVRTQPGTEP